MKKEVLAEVINKLSENDVLIAHLYVKNLEDFDGIGKFLVHEQTGHTYLLVEGRCIRLTELSSLF